MPNSYYCPFSPSKELTFNIFPIQYIFLSLSCFYSNSYPQLCLEIRKLTNFVILHFECSSLIP